MEQKIFIHDTLQTQGQMLFMFIFLQILISLRP